METINPKQYAEDLVKSLVNKVPHGNLYSDLHYAKEEAMKQLVEQIQQNNVSIAWINLVMAEITNIKNI